MFDITPDSATVAWNPPIDDGGSPVTNYIVERCNMKMPEKWERCSAFVRTLQYEIVDLVENNDYKFRIRAENQYGISDPLELDKAITAKYQFSMSIHLPFKNPFIFIFSSEEFDTELAFSHAQSLK